MGTLSSASETTGLAASERRKRIMLLDLSSDESWDNKLLGRGGEGGCQLASPPTNGIVSILRQVMDGQMAGSSFINLVLAT